MPFTHTTVTRFWPSHFGPRARRCDVLDYYYMHEANDTYGTSMAWHKKQPTATAIERPQSNKTREGKTSGGWYGHGAPSTFLNLCWIKIGIGYHTTKPHCLFQAQTNAHTTYSNTIVWNSSIAKRQQGQRAGHSRVWEEGWASAHHLCLPLFLSRMLSFNPYAASHSTQLNSTPKCLFPGQKEPE